MILSLRAILYAIALIAPATDMVWASLVPFDIDQQAYLWIAILAALLAAGSLFYTHFREDERLSAMLFGTAFLIAFSASFGVLNYFLLTVAGPRIDGQLATIDRMAGVDWPALMRFAEMHSIANYVLYLAYISLLPQTAVLVNCLGIFSRPNEIYKFCLSMALGAAITMAIWTVAPSFGAFSLYSVSSTPQFVLAVDTTYAKDLLTLLAQGPGHIAPYDVKGLIAFPSFHTAIAIFVTWYARNIRFLRWPVLILNSLVVLSIPIQGGHHIIDILGGAVVAAISIALTSLIARLVAEPTRRSRANEARSVPRRVPAA
jgi:membrane-associated phospholipid phosphatase